MELDEKDILISKIEEDMESELKNKEAVAQYIGGEIISNLYNNQQ